MNQMENSTSILRNSKKYPKLFKTPPKSRFYEIKRQNSTVREEKRIKIQQTTMVRFKIISALKKKWFLTKNCKSEKILKWWRGVLWCKIPPGWWGPHTRIKLRVLRVRGIRGLSMLKNLADHKKWEPEEPTYQKFKNKELPN